MTLAILLLVAAFILFLVAAFDGTLGRANPLPLGLACWVLSLLVGGFRIG